MILKTKEIRKELQSKNYGLKEIWFKDPSYYILTLKQISDIVYHSSVNIVAADPLTLSSSGTVVEADTGLAQVEPGVQIIGKALEADNTYLLGTTPSGSLRVWLYRQH